MQDQHVTMAGAAPAAGQLPLLLGLQEIDRVLADVRRKIDFVPASLSSQGAALERKRGELQAATDERMRIQAESDRAELEIKSGQARVDALEVKRNQARNNDEYSALTREIRDIKMKISQYEDQVLAALGQAEEKAKQIAQLKQEADAEAGRFGVIQSRADAELAKFRAEEAEVLAKREGARAGVALEALGEYDRVLSKVRERALAPVRGQVCGGCNMTITFQHLNLIMQGKIVLCPTCNRILYIHGK